MIATIKDIRWLEMCQLGAQLFSTCAKRKYFAILLDENGRVLSTGYNGVPSGMPHCEGENGCPRLSANSPSGSNYDNCYSLHAESNCLLFSNYAERKGNLTLVVNGPPCMSCAKLCVNADIKRIVYIEDAEYK